MIKYNKLVREKIPEIIMRSGKHCEFSTLDDSDFLAMLDAKLIEELNEYQESKSLEELADLLEVIMAVAKARGSSFDEIEAIRKDKVEKRGGFYNRILLQSVLENPERLLVYQKQIDWSVFVDGFAIPLAVQEYFQSVEATSTRPGETLALTLLIDGAPYSVNLKNLKNSSDPLRAPRIQIRYHHTDPIAVKFREVFATTYSEMVCEKASVGPRIRVKATTEAYFDMFATKDPRSFVLECHR